MHTLVKLLDGKWLVDEKRTGEELEKRSMHLLRHTVSGTVGLAGVPQTTKRGNESGPKNENQSQTVNQHQQSCSKVAIDS